MESPIAGVHYPTSTGEFDAWFHTDADCLDYLEWLRWPAHDPVRYRDLIATRQPIDRPPFRPVVRRRRPPSLDRIPADRPWRTAEHGDSG